MFQRKRIDVKVGDVFVERIRQPRRLSRLLGLRPQINLPETGNAWLVTRLMHMDGLPHAQLQCGQTDTDTLTTRLIALAALETQETYQRIAAA